MNDKMINLIGYTLRYITYVFVICCIVYIFANLSYNLGYMRTQNSKIGQYDILIYNSCEDATRYTTDHNGYHEYSDYIEFIDHNTNLIVKIYNPENMIATKVE